MDFYRFNLSKKIQWPVKDLHFLFLATFWRLTVDSMQVFMQLPKLHSRRCDHIINFSFLRENTILALLGIHPAEFSLLVMMKWRSISVTKCSFTQCVRFWQIFSIKLQTSAIHCSNTFEQLIKNYAIFFKLSKGKCRFAYWHFA